MDQQTLLYLMTAFVGISAVALVLQLATLFGMYKAARAMQEKVEELMPKVNELLPKVHALLPKVNGLLESSQKVVDQSRQQILDITTKTNDILDITKRQMGKMEDLLTDATGRAKVQLERAEMVIDDTVSRAHETVTMVHGGILRPLREIQGIASGIRTAVAHLTRGGRPSVAQATHDEEMFI